MTVITQYELKCAAHIESIMTEKKVKLWADAFSTDNTAKTRTQIFFGHQRTERLHHLISATTDKLIYLKRYFLEVRVELFTLKNHQEGLDLIEAVLDDCLSGYQPFSEFSKFIPTDSGDATRNKNNGSWIYSGQGFTDIYSDVITLTPLPPEEPQGKIIQIGLFNAAATDDSQIGNFIKDE